MAEEQYKTYNVVGLTCANCAAQFEENVKKLPHVKEAKVNFAAAKLTVLGEATIEELEQAGAFENIKVLPEREPLTHPPYWKTKPLLQTALSGLLLTVGIIFAFLHGQQSPITIFSLASSILIGGYAWLIQGLKNLAAFRFDMKTLMTVAVLGAMAIGEWLEGAALVFLFGISEWLESYSMEKARQSIRSLVELTPREALVKRRGREMTIPVDEIEIGDILIVKPGQKIAMDGRVVKGLSSVNQAAITGEAIPVTKTVNDEVFAGTLNEEGLLEVEVTKRREDTTLAKIIHLVEEAQSERAPSQNMVDRFARYYTPGIMGIALLVTTVPPLFFAQEWMEWIYRGLALLVVACPCALVISTPVSIVSAIGNAARKGVLIKGGLHLEEVGTTQAIAFDKTGTLTRGVPEVVDLITLKEMEEKLSWFYIAAALEKGSSHPLAQAICRHAEKLNGESVPYNVSSFQSIPGRGLEGVIQGQTYYVGSPSFVAEKLGLTVQAIAPKLRGLEEEGKTVVVVADRTDLLGLIAIRDEIRPSSRSVVEELSALGLKEIVLLTGDNRLAAKAIGQQLGISQVRAELLPDEKWQAIRELEKKHRKVAMVGDGINDAPALAASTVGIAMGGAGSDTAMETADIVLMADEISKLPFIFRLSRMTRQIIAQNITFSLLLKFAAMVLIIAGWLPLSLAVLADVGATLLVTLNGMRLAKLE